MEKLRVSEAAINNIRKYYSETSIDGDVVRIADELLELRAEIATLRGQRWHASAYLDASAKLEEMTKRVTRLQEENKGLKAIIDHRGLDREKNL